VAAAARVFLGNDPTEEAVMNTTEGRSSDQSTRKADLKLEVVVISVSDVDRAKQFYGNLG
jgi:hypothetical protein